VDLTGRSVGNYVVVRPLGEGGMGTVYLCEHPLLGRRAALKVLHPDLALRDDVVDRFFHEAKAANDVGNEHIVDVLDFGRTATPDGDVVYILMELLEGESLGARVRRERLTPAEALHVIAQCCEALEASHQKGIVHRDLKPENIFLCRRGEDPLFVKIVDFGIAKLMADPTAQKTRTGVILGTPMYMSPEQCEGKGRVDHRADIYSLGVVMFELFTGRVPFDDPGTGEVMVAHMTRPPPRPSELRHDVSPGIESIILHAMEKDPARRFQSMRELAVAIGDPAAHVASYQTLPLAATMAAPSTLSLAAAEIVRPTPAPSRPLPILTFALGAVALIAVAVAGALGVTLSRRPARELPIVAAPVVATRAPSVAATRAPAPPPVAPEWIQLGIDSDPRGATVSRGEAVLGVTPLSLRLRRGEPTVSVRVTMKGYLDAPRTLTTEATRDVIVVMTKEPSKPHPPAHPPLKRERKDPMLLEPVF
jgi:serine/threonine-protein kinase